MKTTKKKIQAEIKKIHGVDVELDKADGFYYWSGKASCLLIESGTYIQYLNDWSLDRWVSDFTSKVNDYLPYSDYSSIKEAVEKTNWEIN